MGILSSPIPDVAATRKPTPARLLNPTTRQQLVLDILAGQPITQLADHHHVSRKFIYQQLRQAQHALDQAFQSPAPDEAEPLFWLPVTKPWLRQLVLGLTLLCHRSLRGVQELLHDLFDYPLSPGSVPNILHQAVGTAGRLNSQQDLAAVRIGAHDEIFPAGRPVLVGADVASSYCYLLNAEEHRDADTWGVRLLELSQHGFHPQATIADFAGGLRAGQAQALPGVPCRGDVFHALQTVTPLVRYLDHRGYDAIATRSRLQERQAGSEHRQGRKDRSLAAQLRYTREAETQAVTLADEVSALIGWLRQDILAVPGPDYASRCALYDWIVAELRVREPPCPHKIRPLRCLLENQRDQLLAFAKQLDEELQAVAEAYAVPTAMVEQTRQLLSLPASQPRRWQREKALWQRWGCRYGVVREAVTALLASVVRASSVIENLNSRLRSYSFLRRCLGGTTWRCCSSS